VARGVFGPNSAQAERAPAPSAAPAPVEVAAVEPTTGTRAKPAPEGSVLVTGICGRLGKLLARELHRTDQVVGVDRRAFPDRPKDIVHHQLDMRRKKMKDIFRTGNVRAVVHLGVLHDPRRSDRERHSWNIVAFQKLLDYMSQYRVPKLVVLSGANVYGPQANNPQFLTEDAPLLGAQHFGGMRDLVELDMLAQSFFWKHPDTETVVLRPCHIVGRVHNAASNYLRLERPVMVMGFDPMMQVVHEKDVVRAIQLALRPGSRGIFNIRGPGEMPLSHLVKKAGGRPRAVPAPLARVALDQLWKLRLTSFPSQELDHLRYLCMVDDTRARTELGYEPVHSIDRVLRDVRRLRYRVS
jgi:UDP-glucose 4-epimerase